ncbi:unnamed protein product [Acanthoscelides obtectus]|uniref:DUF1758 domain-containing protein n=1 Tax=Acanthoscelides obtectus TaxID=200917 RepID=A0A9P0Q514_ACAOB|nr:unnamed protein product [Acanthoscelides obtectus]CAK1624686.1 hypothetical protein AOBTE_LOCUS2698 [Acanthoscelides obtectus]
MTESEVSDVRALIRRRGIFKAKLTLFEKYIHDVESLDDDTRGKSRIVELEQRINNSKALLSGFDEVQSQIECEHEENLEQSLDDNEVATSHCTLATMRNGILPTARVKAYSTANSKHHAVVRALLDCGSQSSFITSRLCEKLNLTKTKQKLAVSGINDKLTYANYKCDIIIKSSVGSYSFNLSCFVLDKITTDIPDAPINAKYLNIPVNIELADPEFYDPQSIDVLIGANAFWDLLSLGRINLGTNLPTLQNTRLGWVVPGSMDIPTTKSHCGLTRNILVQDQLAKFWEVEEVDPKKPWSVEETLCEEHFVNHLTTSEEGRYVVSLPLKDSPAKLGESRDIAVKRFISLERRLMTNEKFRKLYIDFLDQYGNLGHVTEITCDGKDDTEYFMPHHGVLKESSCTTKLRVMFNASMPTSSGLPLHDLQMTGSIIQQDLFNIIIRFRLRSVVQSSDIKMMYRQVLMNPDQRKLQKIVWRSNPNEPLKTFQLNTVTYGTTAASFLAIRCLHQIADECETGHPTISKIIRNDMYVDDVLTSVNTEDEACYIKDQISRILLQRGFELRKWKSNSKNLTNDSGKEYSQNIVEFSANKDHETKTLGLSWKCDQDVLKYKINVNKVQHTQVTKRTILSRISTIFDPLGLVSPCIIIGKILLQKLWSEKLTWDQPLPSHVLKAWSEFSTDLDALNHLLVERQVTCTNPSYIALHAFADSSESSYGACVYVVSKNAKGTASSNLLCAKSKVAPLKSLTMPRLELCTTLVLSQLTEKVINTLDIKFAHVYCWSDSAIVLGWLQTSPNLLKPFVANRVAEIQRLTETFEWRHVPTCDNPADIVSRGLNPKQLLHSKLWFHGPSWLSSPDDWPIMASGLERVKFGYKDYEQKLRKWFDDCNLMTSKNTLLM